MKDVAIIIPSYNPDETLIGIVKGLRAEGFEDIVVVNDGSDESKQPIFAACEEHGVKLLTHTDNCGKGRALKTAMKWLSEHRENIAGAVTADSDGQHTVEDIASVAGELTAHPDSIIMGCRDFNCRGVPLRSRIGNRATRSALRMSTGVLLNDTQTGLRGIPFSRFAEFFDIAGERYEFEMNVLVYAGKNGIPIREVPIRTLYINGNVGSKFRTVADSLSIYRAFAFTLNSVISTVLELIIFTAANFLLDKAGVPTSVALLISTVIGRVCSSIVNYLINKKAVFNGGGRKSLFRYYIMWFFQMCASYGFVYLFVRLTGASGLMKTVVKMGVDIALFFAGYFVQKNWVFADKKN